MFVTADTLITGPPEFEDREREAAEGPEADEVTRAVNLEGWEPGSGEPTEFFRPKRSKKQSSTKAIPMDREARALARARHMAASAEARAQEEAIGAAEALAAKALAAAEEAFQSPVSSARPSQRLAHGTPPPELECAMGTPDPERQPRFSKEVVETIMTIPPEEGEAVAGEEIGGRLSLRDWWKMRPRLK